MRQLKNGDDSVEIFVRHRTSKIVLISTLSLVITFGAVLAPSDNRAWAVPVTDVPTEIATGVTGTATTFSATANGMNTTNNVQGGIVAKIQRAMQIMQDINQVISTMELGYMMYNDIKVMGSGQMNFFSVISDIMNMASMATALTSSTMGTLSNIGNTVGGMMSPGQTNPMAFATSQSWNQDLQNLNEFSTMASMANGISNSIQVMSLMNGAGFIGKMQAAQAGINVGLMTASTMNQYEQFKIQRAEVHDQRRLSKDTQIMLGNVQNSLDRHLLADAQLYQQGCFGHIGINSSEPSYSSASSAGCQKFKSVATAPIMSTVSTIAPTGSSPSLSLTPVTASVSPGPPLPEGQPSVGSYTSSINPSMISPSTPPASVPGIPTSSSTSAR